MCQRDFRLVVGALEAVARRPTTAAHFSEARSLEVAISISSVLAVQRSCCAGTDDSKKPRVKYRLDRRTAILVIPQTRGSTNAGS